MPPSIPRLSSETKQRSLPGNIWQTVRKTLLVHKTLSLMKSKPTFASPPSSYSKIPSKGRSTSVRLSQRRGAVELKGHGSDYTIKNGRWVLWVDTLSHEEAEHFKEVFALYDKRNKGCIKRKFLGTILRKVGHMPTEDELMEFYHEADANNSGEIEFPQFLTLMAKHRRCSDADLRAAFDALDEDGDKMISREDVEKFMGNVCMGIEKEGLECFMGEVDSNGTGFITFDDFSNTMRHYCM